MNHWVDTYMFGVVLFSYLAILALIAYCISKVKRKIRLAIPSNAKRNEITNVISKCLLVCWLLTSFFGLQVFITSAFSMLLIMLVILFLFD